MTFLAPLFLAGLGALAVPIIIHLTNRPKREAYAFPSLMFLQQVPFRSVRRQRIRHWWLLALRAGLVTLVAGAFARPLLTRWSGSAGAFAAGREVVILLDQSYSMRYGDHWQRAVAAARRAVQELGPEDRASVVLFGDGALSLGQATTDHAALLAALGNTAPGFGATRYAAGLQLARDLLEQSTQPRRRVILISDFQRAGWRPDDAVRMPVGTTVDLVSLAGAEANVAVTGLAVERIVRGQREEATISARVVNLGPAARRGLKVALEVDGRAVQTRTVTLEAGASGAAVFAALPLSDRPARVVARADPDDLPVDDAAYAVVTPGDVIRVLFLSAGGTARQASFVRQALQVGSGPRFDVASGTRLAGYDLAILADGSPASAALAATLGDFARRGGGVLVLLAGQAGAGAWGPAWRALLGGAPGGTVEPAASGTTLAGLRYDHPVFQPFQAPKSGDFGAARVYRYRRFDPDSNALVLAGYEDGSPALVEHRVGRGRVLVWTSGMDNVWSDLPVQPVFLPLVHQMARYLTGYAQRQTAFPVGQVLDLEAARDLVGGASEVSVERPDGHRVALGTGARAATLDQPGFYTVRAVGGDQGAGSVAVNPDPAEGDLTPMDLDAVQAALSPRGASTPAGSPENAAVSPAERERRQGLWWYLVIGAVVLALAETVLSNRLPGLGRAGT